MTINLAYYDWRRSERMQMVIDEINRLEPDVIMLQELSFDDGLNKLLKTSLLGYHHYLTRRGGKASYQGLLTLTRKKPLTTEKLDLSQNRVAQKVTLDIGGKPYSFVNVHLFFSALRDKPRRRQVEEIQTFVKKPAIVAGDFNAFLNSKSMQLMITRFRSAHQMVHKSEPERTYPSPLWLGRSIRNYMRRGGFVFLGLLKTGKPNGWGVPIDFIFLDKGIKAENCRVILERPSNKDKTLYASDHYGLIADLVV